MEPALNDESDRNVRLRSPCTPSLPWLLLQPEGGTFALYSLPPLPVAGGTFALYSRLSRVLGIRALEALPQQEHQTVLDIAGRTLARRSHYHRRSSSTVSPNGGSDAVPAETGQQADVTAGGNQPPRPGAATAFLTSTLHWVPFPADACKQLFRTSVRARIALLSVSVLATAMLIGDGVLTPVISVVSAIQVGGDKAGMRRGWGVNQPLAQVTYRYQ